MHNRKDVSLQRIFPFSTKGCVIMPEENKISKAQQKAVNKYVKNNYDRINVTFPKVERSLLKNHVQITGESVNAFILRSVRETMERDKQMKA